MKVQSYTQGNWHQKGRKKDLVSPVSGEPVAELVKAELDYEAICNYARKQAGPILRSMSIHERAFKIKFLAKYLIARKDDYYELSTQTGATRRDSWIDIEGGIGSMFALSSKARINLSDLPYHIEGDTEQLSRNGTFVGQHICVPRHGVAIHINAFNFPVWGMLEKLAPCIIAGMPAIVKPSPVSSYLAFKVFRDMIESNILPEGVIQFIAADKPGDLLSHLNSQDSVSFTGSSATGKKLKAHPNIIDNNIPFNLEADSLNASILGKDVTPNMEEFELFVEEGAEEMTVKAGQKCTAIRRMIVPENQVENVIEALRKKLTQTTIGDPAKKETQMGPLASNLQSERFDERLSCLLEATESVYSNGNNLQKGAFTSPRVLLCRQPLEVDEAHTVETFGPMTTIMPYSSNEEAIKLANKADGSLVASLFTADDDIARKITLGCAPYHGRFMIINKDSAKESTGHGSPMPQLVHGGPGHAGGGEELGGARAVLNNMQRVALQGSPTTLKNITNEYIKGAETRETDKHPFQQHFEELKAGDARTTAEHTVTQKDIDRFADLSGDEFYAHTDPDAAGRSLFGEIVAHGYFVLSRAAGLFVHPDEGPVILNYGLEDLRFTNPVMPGDTIQAKLIVRQKTVRQKKAHDKFPFGIVYWDVEVTNQNDKPVAEYTILTLVKRRNKLDIDIFEEE